MALTLSLRYPHKSVSPVWERAKKFVRNKRKWSQIYLNEPKPSIDGEPIANDLRSFAGKWGLDNFRVDFFSAE